MATILEFQPKPASPTSLPRAIEAEIIMFPGIRYELRGDGPEVVKECPKVAET